MQLCRITSNRIECDYVTLQVYSFHDTIHTHVHAQWHKDKEFGDTRVSLYEPSGSPEPRGTLIVFMLALSVLPMCMYTWRTLYMHKCIGKEMNAVEEGLKRLTGAVYEHMVHRYMYTVEPL